MLAYLPDGIVHVATVEIGAGWIIFGITAAILAPRLRRSRHAILRRFARPWGLATAIAGVGIIAFGIFGKIDQDGCPTCSSSPWSGWQEFLPFQFVLAGFLVWQVVSMVREARRFDRAQ